MAPCSGEERHGDGRTGMDRMTTLASSMSMSPNISSSSKSALPPLTELLLPWSRVPCSSVLYVKSDGLHRITARVAERVRHDMWEAS